MNTDGNTYAIEKELYEQEGNDCIECEEYDEDCTCATESDWDCYGDYLYEQQKDARNEQ